MRLNSESKGSRPYNRRVTKLLRIAGLLFALSPAFAQSAPQSTAQEPTAPSSETSTQSLPSVRQNPNTNTDEPSYTVRSEVKLVNVFATVTDQNGAPVGGLTKEDFRILEDGNPQNIAVFTRESGLPLSILMALDTSLSTKKDLPLELQSARQFARSILRPIDGMALYEFSDVVNEVLPFTSDMKQIDRGLGRIRVGGATALYDAVYLGSRALLNREGRKVMVIITDGGDTVSRTTYKDAVRASQIAETIVYSIIMTPIEASAGRNLGGEHALIQLSKDTGGKHYYAKSIEQLGDAFQQISDELRTQYLIAYYPPKKAHSDYRRIQLTVSKPAPEGTEYAVRYRTGYFTSKFE